MSSSDYRKSPEASELLPGQIHITVIDEHVEQNRYCGRCGNPMEKSNYTLICRTCGNADADKYKNRLDLKVPKKHFPRVRKQVLTEH